MRDAEGGRGLVDSIEPTAKMSAMLILPCSTRNLIALHRFATSSAG